MEKQASSKTTVINGEFRAPVTQERHIVGFQPSYLQKSDLTIKSGHPQVSDAQDIHQDDPKLNAAILTVVKSYMEERSKRCYREGLDRDIAAKLEKIFIKYYEQI